MAKFTPRFNDDPSTKLNDSEAEENVGLTTDEASGQQQPSTPSSNTSGRKPLHRRYWFWLGLLGVLGSGATVITIWYNWQALERSLPDTADISAYVREKTITIKSSDGIILQQEGPATREQIKFEQVPQRLVQAFIASEDRRFYQHHGVDYQGIFRATASNLHAQGVVEGASTITQQLARLVFLTQEKTVWRKVKEMALAQKIEQKLTKKQILERYFNLVYLGSGAYGIADAAWVYFSKSVDQLSLPEMATIAGLAPAPSSYSPVVDPAAAKERRNLVLRRMHEDGYITAEQTAAATAVPLTIKPRPPKRLQVEAAYFTTYIQQELAKYVKPEVLRAGGLTVETTVNRTWQKSAEKAVKDAIANDGRGENFKQAALVAIDPSNGEVRALVGGDDYSKNQFNHATQAQRQPGSTFKGFVYTAAIATGKSPYDSYEDAPFTVDGYEPKNFSEKFRGWIDMRDALTYSINMVAIKVLIDVGFEPTIHLAQQMGIKSTLGPTYSLALGGYEVNLLELTSAYGTLADQGIHAEVHGIRRITDRRGKTVYEAKYKPKRVLDKNSAAIMTWMLKNVVNEGTGRAAQLDRPVAGKTGTSDEARDLWFVGYIPQLVAGVWLGNDNNQPTWGHSGTAAYTWHEFMAKAIAGMPTKKFPELPNLEHRKGSIKAQPVKPRHITFGKIDPEGRKIDPNKPAGADSNTDQPSTSRRRYDSQDQPDDSAPRRRHRYSEQQDSSGASSGDQPRRRHRSAE